MTEYAEDTLHSASSAGLLFQVNDFAAAALAYRIPEELVSTHKQYARKHVCQAMHSNTACNNRSRDVSCSLVPCNTCVCTLPYLQQPLQYTSAQGVLSGLPSAEELPKDRAEQLGVTFNKLQVQFLQVVYVSRACHLINALLDNSFLQYCYWALLCHVPRCSFLWAELSCMHVVD